MRVNPDHLQRNLVLGGIHYNKKNFNLAARHVQLYYQTFPENTAAAKLLAAAYERVPDYKAAIDTLLPQISFHPDDTTLRSQLGKVYLASGKYAAAHNIK